MLETAKNLDKLFENIKKKIDTVKHIKLSNKAVIKPDTNDDIGKHITYYRKLKGLTQKQLANLGQVSKSLIFKYENDAACNKDNDIICRIFKILGIDGTSLENSDIILNI